MEKKYEVTAVRKDDPNSGTRHTWGNSLAEAMEWINRHDTRHGGRHLYQVTTLLKTETESGWQQVEQRFFTTYKVEITESDFATRVRS